MGPFAGDVHDNGNDIDTDECVSGCVTAICGDGHVKMGHETCDDGNDIDNDECKNDCTLASCGDNTTQLGEECDDGNLDNTDDCAACETATCGDGFVHMDEEECDYNAQPYKDVGYPLCTETCELSFCFALNNTLDEEFEGVLNTWLTPCTVGVAKTVVVTLLDEANQVVYMAKGQISGDWVPNNLTAGPIPPFIEYDVISHLRLVTLQRLMPNEGVDKLMVTSQNAGPVNDLQICYKGLGDGYGVAIFPESLMPQKPKLLVMGVLGGMTNNQRFPNFDGSKEISYEEIGMDVCVDTKPFLGSFVMSVFP